MQLRFHRPPILALTLCLTLPSPSGFAGRDDHGLPEPPSPARGSGSYAPALAFTGVNVLPMDSENLLRDQTVVVEDGVIEAVGPRDGVRVPEGAQIIDGRSKFMIPGLFDMHIHLRRSEAVDHLKLYLAHGVTTVQNMHGSPWQLELRDRLRAGELIGPRLLTTGPTTASVGMSTPEDARRLVMEQKAAGYDAIKHYGSGRGPDRRDTYRALISTAHGEGMRVVGHAPRNLPFKVVLEEGQNSIDHMEEIVYTSEAIREVFGPFIEIQFGRASLEDYPEVMEGPPDPSRLAPALSRLARDVEEAGLYVTPTLIAFATIQDMTTDEVYAHARSPQMAYIDPLTRVQWGPSFNRYRSGDWSDELELMSSVLESSYQLQVRLTGEFAAAGVPIMAGTDAPLPYVFPGHTLHEELKLLVTSGLTPYEALQAATATPARFLGLDHELGTVTAGKRADLVLLDGNPLDDIASTSRISGVVRDGEWYSRERLDAMLEEIAAGYRALAERLAPLEEALEAKNVEGALRRYRALDDDDPELASFVEGVVNSLGYEKLRRDDIGGALDIFRLNTEYFPEAFNTWDSLAEAYMVRGDDELAIRYYQKSLELNPENDNASAMIERIRERDR